MSLVLDSSVTLAWIYPDERSAASDHMLDLVTQSGAVVSGIWRLEVINALQAARRRGRATTQQIEIALSNLLDLDIFVDPETDMRAWTDTARIAAEQRLTIYDATYVELALRRSLPLATFDQAMRVAADALSIPLIDATS